MRKILFRFLTRCFMLDIYESKFYTHCIEMFNFNNKIPSDRKLSCYKSS